MCVQDVFRLAAVPCCGCLQQVCIAGGKVVYGTVGSVVESCNSGYMYVNDNQLYVQYDLYKSV
jgi:hypothetical protein